MGKIAIMDECSLFRGALKALLQKSEEYTVTWETGDPTQLFQMFRKSMIGTLVFDPYFRGNGNGLCFIERIRREFPKLRLLVCTWCLDDDLWLCAMQSGANGFILKSCPTDEIVNAIRRIDSGEDYFMDHIKERILKMFMMNRTFQNGHAFLSPRQRQVVERLLEGDPEKEIANHLGLSVSSVATYLARTLQTLGLKNKVQLVRFADAHPELLGHKSLRPTPTPSPSPKDRYRRPYRNVVIAACFAVLI
jgi:DNA-binding NarL/FixJ family response regulator